MAEVVPDASLNKYFFGVEFQSDDKILFLDSLASQQLAAYKRSMISFNVILKKLIYDIF